jgi:hypothetical protein
MDDKGCEFQCRFVGFSGPNYGRRFSALGAKWREPA